MAQFRSTVFLTGLVLIFVTQFAGRPLWHTDLWDHVQYGSHILQTRTIPSTEPFLPLAANTPVVNTAWGSQVIMALILESPVLGPAALQFLYGLLITTAIGAVGLAVARTGRSVAFGIAGYLIFLSVNWQQFLVIRPQLAGVTLYAVLFGVLATKRDRRRSATYLLPLMFAVWANLHGSFVMGLAVTGFVAAGRWIDAFRRTRSLPAAFCSRPYRSLVLKGVLCAVATLLNPNSWHIYAEVFRVGRHPNIVSMYEWAPLTLEMKQGQTVAVFSLLLVVILYTTPRRVKATEWFPLIVTAGLTLWSSRMINWLAPVLACVLCVHGAAVWRRIVKRTADSVTVRWTPLWITINFTVCAIGVLCTPLGTQIVQGRQPDLHAFTSSRTPVNTALFLKSMTEQPAGIVFCPAEWAGFLTRYGPHDMKTMVNLHVHAIPPNIWADYLEIAFGSPNHASALDRYHINLVVVDKWSQGALGDQMSESADFAVVYEDSQAVIFQKVVLQN